jgi:uncharacterized membrane protein
MDREPGALVLPVVARVAFVLAGIVPWALPLLRAYLPIGALGVAADAIFATMCHRLPERTLVIAGVAMPLCSRCVGIFSGAAVGALAAWPRISARGHRLLITAAGAAMLLDVVTQDMGVHPVWHATRLATGFLFGYAVGAGCLVALLRASGAPLRADAGAAETW